MMVLLNAFRLSLALAAASSLGFASPSSAEVLFAEDDRFAARQERVVEADRKQVWLALISPSEWWSPDHTWTGDAANLTLTPQAGGCFCETIPAVDEPDRFTLAGSVEHMRVVQAYPEEALRMAGALGPLQSEPVTGVMTIALSDTDEGARIVLEYFVGGAMRYETADIAQAMDEVLAIQMDKLAALFTKESAEAREDLESNSAIVPEPLR